MEINNRILYAVMTDIAVPMGMKEQMTDVSREIAKETFDGKVFALEIDDGCKMYVSEKYWKSTTTESIRLYQQHISENVKTVKEFAEFIGVLPPVKGEVVIATSSNYIKKYNWELIKVKYRLIKIPILPYLHQNYGVTFSQLYLIFPYDWEVVE